MSDLVENPEDSFPNVVAYITMTGKVKDNINLVQFIFYVWSFEISGNILRNQKKIRGMIKNYV